MRIIKQLETNNSPSKSKTYLITKSKQLSIIFNAVYQNKTQNVTLFINLTLLFINDSTYFFINTLLKLSTYVRSYIPCMKSLKKQYREKYPYSKVETAAPEEKPEENPLENPSKNPSENLSDNLNTIKMSP